MFGNSIGPGAFVLKKENLLTTKNMRVWIISITEYNRIEMFFIVPHWGNSGTTAA